MLVTRAVILGTLVIGLAACTSSAPKVAVSQPNDNYLSCRDLAREIQEASYYRESAVRTLDKQKQRSLLFKASARSDAGNAADARIKNLKNIFSQKRCHLSRFNRAYMQQMTPLPPIYN